MTTDPLNFCSFQTADWINLKSKLTSNLRSQCSVQSLMVKIRSTVVLLKEDKCNCDMVAKLAVCCLIVLLFTFVECILAQKRLVWIPNDEGIMSQFVQIKIMQHFARVSRRQLFSAPFTTAHIAQKKIMLGDLFELPGVVFDRHRSCRGRQYLMLNSSQFEVCAYGSVPSMGGDTRRDTILHGIKLMHPPLVIHKRYTPVIDGFLKNLGINKGTSYTVVHWRRGDQLKSRCKQSKDSSVNCGSARELIERVQNFSKDSLVYIATNEPANSNESTLLLKAGYKLFHHGRSNSVNVTSDSIPGFMIDLTLMLRCSTFLAWGVSLMNDVVEHQRWLDRRSYCTSYSEKDITYPTWCWQRKQMLLPSNRLLVKKSITVGGIPFVPNFQLNTSNMPSYEHERKDNYSFAFRTNVV